MASSTIGRLYSGDYAIEKHRVAAAPISGAGVNRLYDTSEYPLVVNGNWQKVIVAPQVSGNNSRALAVLARNIAGSYSAPDPSYAGPYTLAGHTTLSGAPFQAQVLVYPEEAPSLCVRSTITDATGVFSFTGLAAGRYTVLGIDITDIYNGVVYCMVVAVP